SCARYQMFGTRRLRCGSLARIAPPPVSAPPTAEPLLPIPLLALSVRATARAPCANAILDGVETRRSNTDAPGIGTGSVGLPCIGASQYGDGASRKSASAF